MDCFLLLAEIDVSGYFEQDDCETDAAQTPNILHQVEKGALVDSYELLLGLQADMQPSEAIHLIASLMERIKMCQEALLFILVDYLRDCDFNSGV
jgi:hypothetical protein